MTIGTLTLRADASPAMGAGHVMRMIALGQAWQDRGGDVRFIGNVGPLAQRIRDEGFGLHELDAPWPDRTDLDFTCAHTPAGGWLAMDGYHFDAQYQQALLAAGLKTLVVDDVCDRNPYAATALLNQNADAGTYGYETGEGTTLLLGNRYTLLRREFRQRPEPRSGQPSAARNVLVTMGGSDPMDLTTAFLSEMARISGDGLHLKVVAGSQNPRKDELDGLVRRIPCRAEILFDAPDMAELMDWADVAVAAAGSTCWELASRGVPMIAVRAADNQAGVCRGLEAAGAAICLEGAQGAAEAARMLTELAKDADRRQTMSRAGRELIDGLGPFRVADFLYASTLRLRPARQEDCALLHEWRNHEDVRRQSFSPEVIPWEDHERWFRDKLDDDEYAILMAEDPSGLAVGQIRFAVQGDEGLVSINVSPDMTGRGLGTAITILGRQWFCAHHPGKIAVALVKPENGASRRMFLKGGFVHAASRDRGDEFKCFEYRCEETDRHADVHNS